MCLASAASKSHGTEQGVVVCSASAASRSHGHDQKPPDAHKDEQFLYIAPADKNQGSSHKAGADTALPVEQRHDVERTQCDGGRR